MDQNLVITADEASRITQQFQVAAQAIYKSQSSWDQAIRPHLSAEDYQRVVASAAQSQINSSESIASLLEDMSQKILNLPVVDVELAFRPSQSLLDDLVNWFSQSGPGPCRLRFRTDYRLLGGLIIGYQGKILDYSLASRLKKI